MLGLLILSCTIFLYYTIKIESYKIKEMHFEVTSKFKRLRSERAISFSVLIMFVIILILLSNTMNMNHVNYSADGF
jgi:hypothetical protein